MTTLRSVRDVYSPAPDPAPPVIVVYGISPSAQESMFMNATLQGADDPSTMGWSIATFIKVPHNRQRSQLHAAQYLARVCESMVRGARRLGAEVTIEVQVGREEN